MKFGDYIDSRFDNLICPHTVLTADCVKAGESFYPHQTVLHDVFNELRSEYGSPIAITSGFRCHFCQHAIRLRWGDRAARTSEHEFNAALDIRPWRWRVTPSSATGRKALQVEIRYLKSILEKNSPEIRIGSFKYDDTLIHMGVGYLLDPNPDPQNWRTGVRF